MMLENDVAARGEESLSNASIPELLAVQIQVRSGFDLAVAVHFGLAGEPHFVLMTDAGEESQGIDPCVQPLPEATSADVLLATFDVDSTTAAETVSSAIDVTMRARIQLNAVLHGFLAEVGTLRDFDGSLFVDELDGGHG